MLVTFVLAYLALSLVIGLVVATRVHNGTVVAGKYMYLPLEPY